MGVFLYPKKKVKKIFAYRKFILYLKCSNQIITHTMSHTQRIIEVQAKSRMRFQEIIGKPITWEQAVKEETEKHMKSLEQVQNETWVDITTGKKIQGRY